MKYIIDRFEGEYAVCEKEDKTFENILIKNLPENVKENDVIELVDNNYVICKSDTECKKQMVGDLVKDMWE